MKALTIQIVHRQRLSDEVVRQLEDLILDNELSIGDVLPPERDLAARLGVSRNILREAISSMVQKGLLEVRQGSGTYVACPTAELLGDSLTFFVKLNATGFYDLLEARVALEVQIAELAAIRCNQEDIQMIETRLSQLEAVVGDAEQYVEADIRFHTALAEAAKNEVLQLLLDTIRGATRENIRLLVKRHPTSIEEAMSHHRRIIKAIEQHHPEEAREAMREHLDSVREDLQELEAAQLQGSAKLQGSASIERISK
jgi:GntR family transcriptional repressor for pyruvate dehydrogenase complex